MLYPRVDKMLECRLPAAPRPITNAFTNLVYCSAWVELSKQEQFFAGDFKSMNLIRPLSTRVRQANLDEIQVSNIWLQIRELSLLNQLFLLQY